MADRHPLKVPPGGFRLTDEALRAIGVEPSRPVPLVDVPWRPDWRDDRDVRSCEDACAQACFLAASDPSWKGCTP